jgi:hypothetical protein
MIRKASHTEAVPSAHLDSHLFMETQEDFVFSRDLMPHKSNKDIQDTEESLEDLEVEWMLRGVSPITY